MTRLAFRCAGAMAVLSVVAGCAGYRLGTSLPPDISVVHVPTFVNETSEPRLETEMTRATVQEFQRDGSLAVSTVEKADVSLAVVLTDFGMRSLRYEQDRAKATEEYRLYAHARVTLTQRATGKVLMTTEVIGEAEMEPTGDLSSAKRVAMPAVAADLAHRIVESVVEFW